MERFSKRFLAVVDEIFKKYPDYCKKAYGLVYEALGVANERLKRSPSQSTTGADLVREGIIPLAQQHWGVLAYDVLAFWGLKTGVDFEKILERLVEFAVFRQDVNDNFSELNDIDIESFFRDPFSA